MLQPLTNSGFENSLTFGGDIGSTLQLHAKSLESPEVSVLTDAFHLDRLAEDHGYFWDIWLLFKKRVYNYCRYRLLASHDDAEDLCSETMLKGYEKLTCANDDTNILSWFLRICRNTHFDLLRRVRTNIRYQAEKENDEDEVVGEIGAFFHKEKCIATLYYIRRVIEEFPKKVSGICLSYFFEEKTYKELSAEYSCTEAYIRKQIYNVRRYLLPACHRYMNDC